MLRNFINPSSYPLPFPSPFHISTPIFPHFSPFLLVQTLQYVFLIPFPLFIEHTQIPIQDHDKNNQRTRCFPIFHPAPKVPKAFVNSAVRLWESKPGEGSDAPSFLHHSTRVKAWTRRVENHIRLSKKGTMEKRTLDIRCKTLEVLQGILDTMKRAVGFLVPGFSLVFPRLIGA